MSLPELKLDLDERRQLRKGAHHIFNRMATDTEALKHQANNIENGINYVLTVLLLSVFAVASFAILTVLRPELRFFQSELHFILTIGLFAVVATGVVVALTARSVGKWLLTRASDILLDWRKYLRQSSAGIGDLETVREWLRTRPTKIEEIARDAFPLHKPADLLPSRLHKAVQSVLDRTSPEVALVVRGLIERKPWAVYLRYWFRTPRDLSKQNYFIQARTVRNSITTSLVLDAFGAEMRDEVLSGPDVRRDYHTRPRRQITGLFSSNDIPIRFRSGAPQYDWPNEAKRTSVNETATFRVFHSIENPIRRAIFVAPVAVIIKEYQNALKGLHPDLAADDEATRAKLKAMMVGFLNKILSTNVEIFGKLNRATLQKEAEGSAAKVPVLRILSGPQASSNRVSETDDLEHIDWGIRWDPNRINWDGLIATESDHEVGGAFATLVEAIDRTGRHAIPVVLARGDSLIVDNLRCLVGRFELDPRTADGWHWLKRLAWFPEDWWLSGYYGFRQFQAPEQAHDDS